MGDLARSLDELLDDDSNDLPYEERERLYSERVLGQAAIVLHQRGHSESAALMLDVVSIDFDNHTELMDDNSWARTYHTAVLEIEPFVIPRFTDDRLNEILAVLKVVFEKDHSRDVRGVRTRDVVPRVSEDWREQLAQQMKGGKQSNQARKVKLEPTHPVTDGLHFTNEWEHRVYTVLRERQLALPDIETIGILPLPGMRVLGHTFEPDLLVTYKGRAGVIEIDGPHHKGRRSDDASRERLLRNAGIKHIDRIDVRDSTTKAEVEKFVDTFLKHLTA